MGRQHAKGNTAQAERSKEREAKIPNTVLPNVEIFVVLMCGRPTKTTNPAATCSVGTVESLVSRERACRTSGCLCGCLRCQVHAALKALITIASLHSIALLYVLYITSCQSFMPLHVYNYNIL